MDATLVRQVWQRAGNCCEYCRMLQEFDENTFEIDHIVSKQHGGLTIAGNLALSCFYCNAFKGPNIAGRDRVTRKLAPLFNPRRHKWDRHFRWQGGYLIGRTPIGRVTIALLSINAPLRVELRDELIAEGLFPP
jgi:HNH endonuclease